MRGYFITGTDTDAGKTTAAMALLRAFARRGVRTAPMKPVASGCHATAHGLRNDDALALLACASVRPDYALVNPYAFAPAIAPHLAAHTAGVTIDFDSILRAAARIAEQADLVIVEGAGGWRVPLNATQTSADLARMLGLPVILVVGMRLGCLNHALLSAESIAAHGLTLAGWIANQPTAQRMECWEENIAALRERLPAPLLGVLPFMTPPDGERMADCLEIELLLGGRASRDESQG